MKQKTVVIGVTGSIACYKALDVIRSFRMANITAEIILTKEAEEFIRPILFQQLSGNKIIRSDMFQSPEVWDLAHISLAKKADLVLIVPATANIIGKIANGICDDMLTCTVCATKAKVLLAPAMNEGMYKNPIVQENISKLKKFGFNFTGPLKGKLACGDEGMGHIQNVDVIVKEAKKLLR